LPIALICGVSGQDGAYLAALLLEKGYRVVGTSRDPATTDLWRLNQLGIRERVELRAFQPIDREQACEILAEIKPDEIYALAAQSSVGASFSDPGGTVDSIVGGTVALLEAIRVMAPEARLCHASSGDSYGELDGVAADENSPFRPVSPYGAAKASAHLLVTAYRRAFGLFAANAILFNHESPLRSDTFVTRKIVAAASRIAAGSEERLKLGRIDMMRDWGWAPEYSDGLWRILQHDIADDFVLATGKSWPLQAFVDQAFRYFGLHWREHVDFDPWLCRPTDPHWSGGNPARAADKLGWAATSQMPDVVRALCQAEGKSAVNKKLP
jgi:GDPmannose 4,6-dehydratase